MNQETGELDLPANTNWPETLTGIKEMQVRAQGRQIDRELRIRRTEYKIALRFRK